MTLMITFTFALMFIIRSCLILWSASTLAQVPLILFAILEIIPTFVLLFYVCPPPAMIACIMNSIENFNRKMADESGTPESSLNNPPVNNPIPMMDRKSKAALVESSLADSDQSMRF